MSGFLVARQHHFGDVVRNIEDLRSLRCFPLHQRCKPIHSCSGRHVLQRNVAGIGRARRLLQRLQVCLVLVSQLAVHTLVSYFPASSRWVQLQPSIFLPSSARLVVTATYAF